MPKPPNPAPSGATSRAEKLSILSAMLGPDAMARVREAHPSSPADAPPVEMDADRATWHRNRLLERLRQQSGGKTVGTAAGRLPKSEPSRGARARVAGLDAQRVFGTGSAGLDARLAKISDIATLSQEHPAIIARLIKTLSRDERVEALKSLSGPMARSIVRRLR